MSGRQIFTECEKICLQELIIKYKLNCVSTISAGNQGIKKTAWARLVEEYNSIETNSRRTEAQLKKCWDNLKTRKKAILALEKRQRMRTGGGPYQPPPGPSKDSQELIEDALLDQTDVEITGVIDSDMDITFLTEESIINTDDMTVADIEDTRTQNTHTQEIYESERTGRDERVISGNFSASQRADYIFNGQQRTDERVPGNSVASQHADHNFNGQQRTGAKNIRASVIGEEFNIRQQNYLRIKERDEELHKLKMAEYQWRVKEAEELYKKACIEHQCAKETLEANRIKRAQNNLYKNE